MCLGMLATNDEGTADSSWGMDGLSGKEKVEEHITEEDT